MPLPLSQTSTWRTFGVFEGSFVNGQKALLFSSCLVTPTDSWLFELLNKIINYGYDVDVGNI